MAKPRTGLPAAALIVLYVAALVTPLALASATGISLASPWSEAATAFGIVAGVMLALQFVSSGRFESLSGRIGIDVTMAFHKWAARLLLVAVLLHVILYTVPAFVDDPRLGLIELRQLFMQSRNGSGVVAAALVAAIVALAIFRHRIPITYEFWRASHLIGGIVVVALVSVHAHRAGSYSHALSVRALWPLLALFVLSATSVIYGMRTVRMVGRKWRVVHNRRVADDLVELSIRPEGSHRLAYRAGQFAWIAFAPRLFPLFDHPMSITSSPASRNDVSFLIKKSGDFTNRIDAIAVGTRVGLDAPHGSFVLDDPQAEAILLVAGGIGIAPVKGLLADLSACGDKRPVRLIYRGVSPSRMIAPAEIEATARGLDLSAIYSARQANGDDLFETGRPDRAMLARALAGVSPARTVAMICGPGSMIVAVADTLHDLGLPLGRIHYERFDYGDESRSAKDRLILWGFRAMAIVVLAAIATFAVR